MGVWGDYDGDGFLDLFVPNTATGWKAMPNFLYRNNRDGSFTRQSAAQAGPVAGDTDTSCGGVWADANNDGLLDLLVANFIATGSSPPVQTRLYLNQGNGAFRSADAGDLTKPSYAAAWSSWVDYDKDGWLDALICAAWSESRHRTNLLYHGVGDGVFRLVTNNVVATDKSGYSNGTAWGDFDNDGWPDLLLSNAYTPDFLYHNEGQGQFTRLTNSILEKSASIHAAWADYDNDGLLDVVAADHNNVRLFRNTGQGTFVLATHLSLPSTIAAVWGDYDNDGYLDLVVTRGGQSSATQNRLFRNNGNGTFLQVEDAFTRPSARGMGSSWGDYDNDGFLDLFIADYIGKNVLYHNLGNANHWIKFQLQGTASNRSAIGAKVRVKATIGGKTFWQMREVSASGLSQNDLRPHFGLGDATNVDLVRIEWPSGSVQELQNLPAGQFVTLWEPPAIRAALEPDGSCQLTIVAEPNRPWRIETSQNLVDWQSLATVTSANATYRYTDTAARATAHRFYRSATQ